MTFNGQSFLEKKAANPAGILQNMSRTYRNGKFTTGAADRVLDPNKIKTFDEGQIAENAEREYRKSSSGAFTVDGLGWMAKKIPGVKEPYEKTKATFLRTGDNVDNYLGSLATGKNPSALRGKIFSKPDKKVVGNHQDDDGIVTDLITERPKASLFAPVEKTVKFTTPFLATAFVADKLYPDEKNDLGEIVNQATYENELQKSSSIFDESLSEQMDKIASMQKIAELEDRLDKYAEELESALMDKKAVLERLEHVAMEKVSMEKRAATAERNLLEKQAEHEELRLRTIAQKRSKVAVNLAEGMLENKLIKQAQYKDTIDKLMECDESTISMYESLVKEARTGSDCLETLSYFGEYKGNEKLATNLDLAKNGLSRRGQSMGEAARDLTK